MKKLKRLQATDFFITDTGQTVPATGELIIDPANYVTYKRSDDVITAIATGDLVYNDGTEDLSLAQATMHLQDSFPSTIAVNEEPAFASKKILVNGVLKSLFKRVHGVNISVPANTELDLDFTVPYPTAKFTGAEILGAERGDTLNFTVHDDVINTYSQAPTSPGPTYYPHFKLNQFGFDVELPDGTYKNTSNYDADIYAGMIIRCSYKNNTGTAKIIAMNVWLHEVK